MDNLKDILAKNISELRQNAGMTQLELAEQLHYSDKAVSKWERGESVPEISTLVAIAELFGVTLDYLVEEKHNKNDIDTHKVKNQKDRKHIIITAISILVVCIVALVVYVLIDIISSSVTKHWITFICAIPCVMIVWLVFNSIWLNRRRNYLIISLLMWSIFLLLHLILLLCNINIWQIYLLGLPGQLIILLWSGINRKK